MQAVGAALARRWCCNTAAAAQPGCPRIIAPSVYIYLASIIPALAFGEQISSATQGQFTGVQVLVATALSGIAQSVFGGQPLLIVGVAEPTVILYSMMFRFAEDQGFAARFLPWATWVALWSGLFLCVMAWGGAPPTATLSAAV